MASIAIRPGKLHACILALAAVNIIFGTLSCFSFRVTVPLEPECVVSNLAIIHSEPATLDFEKPINDDKATTSDPALYSLIKVLQVSKPLKLQWHWYSPDNRLVRRSKSVVINAKGKYLAYFAAWDTLAQSYYAEKKGGWTVVITVDGNFLSKKEFSVN